MDFGLLIAAVGFAWLGYEIRIWRYFPTPANWSRNRQGVQALVLCAVAATLAFVLFSNGLRLVETGGSSWWFLAGLGAAGAAVFFGNRLLNRAIAERRAAVMVQPFQVRDEAGRIIDLKDVNVDTTAKAVPIIRRELDAIAEAMGMMKERGMTRSPDGRTLAELQAFEVALRNALRTAQAISAPHDI